MNTIGIYYPENSFWHGLDPRSKIAAVLAIMLALFSSSGIKLGLVCLLTVILYRTSRLPWSLEWEVISKFKWLLLISFTINLLVPYTHKSWYATITGNTSEAFSILLRLAVILLIAVWFSYVTKPMTIVEGLTGLLRPFKRLDNGGFDIPLMMGLVVRFIPELFAESENIIIAQRIRGIQPGFKIKNSSAWIKSTIIPIFLASIRKAAALAVAMEARGYRPGMRRSPIEQLKLRYWDYLIIGLSLSLIIWQIFEVW